jgi:hydroxyacylglutathione hydrolase
MKSSAKISNLHIGPEKNFCYIILCPETNECALIDPAFEFDRVIEWTKSFSKTPPTIKYLIATHGHRDHSGGFPDMLERLPEAKVVAHEDEKARLQKMGIKLDVPLKDGEIFNVGNVKVKAMHTPGHTEGGCCYLVEDQVFTGDTLFVGYCGRTDFPGGSSEELYESLGRLKTLPGSTIVLPGHDYGVTPKSTIQNEITTNPSMMAKTFAEFEAVP